MSKILIVEDEEITAFALELFCENLGYLVVDTVNSYSEALASIKKYHPDLILSDIQLNGEKTGLDLALISEQKYGIPTIFLTAYYNEEILKQAKHINFYGYIVKPYKEVELEATLKLALFQIEKHKNHKERYIAIADHTFDMKELTLYDDVSEISLSKKSKKLLYFLSLYLGQTKTYEEIIDYIYEDSDVSIDTLRHLIKRTKQHINPKCIKSQRNIGYKLERC